MKKTTKMHASRTPAPRRAGTIMPLRKQAQERTFLACGEPRMQQGRLWAALFQPSA